MALFGQEELQQLGRYRIVRSLGQGAMADVYLAELETIGGFKRKAALKVVLLPLAQLDGESELDEREEVVVGELVILGSELVTKSFHVMTLSFES